MRQSEFVFDSINSLCYELYKMSLNRGRSYTDYHEWLKDKKETINPKNNDDKCFQCDLSAALNYQSIKKDPQNISKIKTYIDQYNWKEIDFQLHRKDWKMFESNNKSIALNILYLLYNTEKIKICI